MLREGLLCYIISKDMPDTRLILHVKGTEAQTAELPKEVVRAAISKGEITNSQLIWSSVDNSWKQVREWPDLLPVEQFILHVKGTESETTQLPKKAIRTALSKGELSHSQLIWSSADNSWKQVRELPELLPSQKLAPAPRVASVPRAEPIHASGNAEAIIPESPTGPVDRATASAGTPHVRVASEGIPHVRVAVTPAGMPQARVASPETPAVRTAPSVHAEPTENLTVKEEDDFHPVKWVCIVLGIVILLVVGGNYLLVDQPLVSRMSQTRYADVPVYAHLGAFMQPNVIVIHIPPSAKITPDNITDFLVNLAHSTPQNPVSRDIYDRIALTSGWTAQYSFSGGTWQQLGDLGQDDESQRKAFLMAQMADASGRPLTPESTLNEATQQARSDKVWADFVAHFTAKR